MQFNVFPKTPLFFLLVGEIGLTPLQWGGCSQCILSSTDRVWSLFRNWIKQLDFEFPLFFFLLIFQCIYLFLNQEQSCSHSEQHLFVLPFIFGGRRKKYYVYMHFALNPLSGLTGISRNKRLSNSPYGVKAK